METDRSSGTPPVTLNCLEIEISIPTPGKSRPYAAKARGTGASNRFDR